MEPVTLYSSTIGPTTIAFEARFTAEQPFNEISRSIIQNIQFQYSGGRVYRPSTTTNMKLIPYIFMGLMPSLYAWSQPKLPITDEIKSSAEAVLAIPISKRIPVPMKGYLPLPIGEFDVALNRLTLVVDTKTVAALAPYEGESIIAKIVLPRTV